MVEGKKSEEKSKKLQKAEEIDEAESKKKLLKKPKKTVKKTKTIKKKEIPARDIGIDVPVPDRSCEDPNCPFHGTLSVRGQIMDGIVVSSSMGRSAVVAREYLYYLKKYERYEKRTSRYIAHNPECIDAKVGDMVKIVECRPLSKNKSFVIVKKGGW